MTASSWLYLISLYLLSLAATVAITALVSSRCTRRHLPVTCPHCGREVVEGGLRSLTWTDHVHRRAWVPRVSGRHRPALVRHAHPGLGGDPATTQPMPRVPDGVR